MAFLKKLLKGLTPDTKETEPSAEERQLYRYWFNCIKRATKAHRPDQWKSAEDRLQCKEGDTDSRTSGQKLPYVNGFRQHYEGLKSFLDQTEPSFKVTPSDAFMTDPDSIKQAECDATYLKHIWTDQNCQVAESQKLDSTLQRNVGCTVPGFDKKKWMPKLDYIPARRVLIDDDCGGILDKASWEGYWEEISLEELKSANPDLTGEDIEKIKQSAGSVLDEENQKEVNDGGHPEDKRLYTVVKLYHIFARNDAAIRIANEEGEEELPPQSVVDELNLTTPRRYLQFVKGYHKPLKNNNEWPYDLDDNEFPQSILRFNTPVESLYGYTDFEQMNLLDIACDNIMYYIERAAYWEASKKFAGGPEANDVTEATLNAFLDNTKKHILMNFLDANGKPKIQEIDTGNFNPELVQAYKIFHDMRNEASLLSELTAEITQYKDVTALGVRTHTENVHQKINRRLGGPEGYEASIAEDAVKLLEIAHQFVPRFSVLEISIPIFEADEKGEFYDTGEREWKEVNEKNSHWESAKRLLLGPNVQLVALGVDAIVGADLAQYWRTTKECPARVFKLSTKVKVMPGSTRTITKEHRAAMLLDYYERLFKPLYEKMGLVDLDVNFVSQIANLVGLSEVKDLLPDATQVQQFKQYQEKMEILKIQMEAQQAMPPPVSESAGKEGEE